MKVFKPYFFSIATLLSVGIFCSLVLNTNLQAKSDIEPHESLVLGFSVKKMDDRVSPKNDFYRYSSGTWLENTIIPSDKVSINGVELQSEHIKTQLKSIMLQASRRSSKVEKGNVIQQVGDFYRAGINNKYLTELGIKPIEPLFKKIDAINSPQSLAQVIAELQVKLNSAFFMEVGVSTDLNDRQHYSIYIGDAYVVG